MKFFTWRFNLYLQLLAGLWLAGGCAAFHKADKPTAAVRVHLQNPESVSAGETVSVLRSEPMLVRIAAEPLLTEFHVASARLVDAAGGFMLEIKFNRAGALMLEQYTGANPGKHLAIFAQWGKKLAEGRWLAAPLINHRFADGVLLFAPDASREEMEVFVKSLNETAAKILKRALK
jgi:hypothetical protein